MYDFPCVHRGEPTGEQADCGCGLGLQPIYPCYLPALGGKNCLIRMGNCKQKLLAQGLLSCASCDFREDPTPPRPKLEIKTHCTDGRVRAGDFHRQIELAGKNNPYSPGPLIVDCDTHGFGDALIMAWIAEGTKGSPRPCFLRANGEKRELLRIFGQSVVASDTAIDQASMVGAEQSAGYSRLRLRFRADQLGVSSTPKRPTATLSPEADAWGKRCHATPAVLLAPQSNHANREWPAQHWVALAERLEKAAIPYLFTGQHARPEYEPFPGIYGQSPLEHVVALFKHARAVVGIDSFPMNLAGTLDVPSLCLLSITTPQVFEHTPSVRCLIGPTRSPQGLAAIAPDTVFAKLKELLDVSPPAP
jgi:hypothetical protein